MKLKFFCALFLFTVILVRPACAEFMISSAIIEFTTDGQRQQDVEISSRSKENDYIVSEIYDIQHPGMKDEKRVLVEDVDKAGLLVTPDKMVLPAGGQKTLRFVLLQEPDAQEHVYRVVVKPVVKGIQNNQKIGLKILVGYEVLVIVRPQKITPVYSAARSGKVLTIANNGNSDVLFQSGQQCSSIAKSECKKAPVERVYPGEKTSIALPLDLPVTYSVWDGANSVEKTY